MQTNQTLARVAAFILIHSLAAQLPPGPEPTPLQRSVDRATKLAEQLRERHGIPGLAVAVAAGGRLVFSAGFGLADVEQGVPVTPLTKFRLGSVSKLVTAAAIARLVEDGELDLDADVRDYVPYFPDKGHPILIRQLASHTGGIPHYGAEDDRSRLRFRANVREALELFQDLPLLHEPGTRYRYSSYGFNLLSAAIEGASETDFLRCVRERVLEPLGMSSTEVDHRFKIVPHRTRFYHRLDEGVLVNAPAVDNSHKWASGGYLATAEDVVRLGLAHASEGFFTKATLDIVFEPQPQADLGNFKVGIGWRISGTGDDRVYHHGGASEGGRAFILVEPATDTVVAMLTNYMVGIGLAEAKSFAAVFE